MLAAVMTAGLAASDVLVKADFPALVSPAQKTPPHALDAILRASIPTKPQAARHAEGPRLVGNSPYHRNGFAKICLAVVWHYRSLVR